MNQYLQIISIIGIGGGFFIGVGYYAENNIENSILSQQDKIEISKNYAGEHIKLIEVTHSPLRVDVVNIGVDIIEIKSLFVDGVEDDNFTIDGEISVEIEQKQVITIEPSISSGTIIKIITENNKLFNFE